jgi:hypothetical protein
MDTPEFAALRDAIDQLHARLGLPPPATPWRYGALTALVPPLAALTARVLTLENEVAALRLAIEAHDGVGAGPG